MRTLAALTLVVTGCLSAPTGRDPATIDASVDGMLGAWPPPQADIAALGAGDLDGDGRDDLIAVDANAGRVFLLRGGVDVRPDGAPVTTTSDSAPLPGVRPPAAAIVAQNGGARFVVVLDNPASGPRVTVFDAQLVMVSQAMAGGIPAPAGTTVTLRQTTFGMGGNAVFLSVPDAVYFMEGSSLPMANPGLMLLPETGATAFTSVQAVGGYVVPGNPVTPRVVVSEPTFAQRADTTGPGIFNWSTVRTAGAAWTAQTVADVTGDTFPDIIGFAPEGGNPADICVLDVNNASAPTCFDTQFGMDTAWIAAGPVANAGQTDVVLIHVNPGQPTQVDVFVVPRLRIAGTVMADGFSPPTMFPIQDPMLALAQLDGGGKEILVMGRSGSVQCARSNGGAPTPCQ